MRIIRLVSCSYFDIRINLFHNGCINFEIDEFVIRISIEKLVG